MKKTIITLTTAMIVSTSLTACFWHKNPLLKTNKRESVVFLIAASQYGGKKFGIDTADGAGLYSSCMQGDSFVGYITKQNPKIFCQKLYKDMVEYARTTKEYKKVMVSDLTDPQLWKKIKGVYSVLSFSAV